VQSVPEALDELRQAQEILGPKPGPARRDPHEGIGRSQASPPQGQRDQPLTVAERDPVLVPVVMGGDDLETLAEQRVEGVGHRERAHRIYCVRCSR
jgi:hypothetical protein